MKKKKTYRHEIKYLISYTKIQELEKRIKQFAVIDEHLSGMNNKYHIRSLYFDDMFDSAYYEKVTGVDNRRKWRIRIYDYDMSTIKLECKSKMGGGIFKESVLISEEEYKKILFDPDISFLKERGDLLRRFYIESFSKRLRPKIIVDYERIPYVFNLGTVRITFDTCIRAGIGYEIDDIKLPTMSVFPSGETILELKYTEFMPGIFQTILSGEIGNEMSASKYVLCRDVIKKLYV